MTTFQKRLVNELGAGADGEPISQSNLVYLQERFRGRVFDFLIGKFEEARQSGLKKSKLARRIRRSPEVINRLLAAPSNLTLDTISDLLVGICGEELTLGSSALLNRAPVNYSHLDDAAAGANDIEKLTQDMEKSASALDDHNEKRASALDVLKSAPQQSEADRAAA